MIPLIAGLACTGAQPEAGDTSRDTSVDTARDTGADSAADTSGDTSGDTSADTADTSDTGSPPLPGSLEVSGQVNGVPFAYACSASDPDTRFPRYWSNSLGNIAGSFGCVDALTLTVSFMNPHPGEWSASADGMGFVFTDATGGTLSWYEPTPSAWKLTLSEAEYVDLQTLSLAGSLSGIWEVGDVSATFDLQVPCNNCD
ncbi:hypothetical protein LBMAG42_10760 [Deltaproteobacteria bacterium]|nr:hypothetical protein LBMAG42_10760 [Deltaproteobacteria bacterium]